MLILSRRLGESIVIADNVYLKVLDVSGSQVRLGIEAPRSISVDREEIHLKRKQEKENQDSESSPPDGNHE